MPADLKTLPAGLRPLLRETEQLHCRLDFEARLERHLDSRELEYRLRKDLTNQLAHHISQDADFRSFSADFGRERYMEASIYAFNEAELAVLLTRAYMLGQQGR